MEFETKDSGQRRDFKTGARRDLNKGKGRYDLLPVVCLARVAKLYGGFDKLPPLAIKRLACLYERGAEKYGDSNWQKGIPSQDYLQSLLRHAYQALEGKVDEDHLAAICFNALGEIWNQLVTTDQLNLPKQGISGTCFPLVPESYVSGDSGRLLEHAFAYLTGNGSYDGALDHMAEVVRCAFNLMVLQEGVERPAEIPSGRSIAAKMEPTLKEYMDEQIDIATRKQRVMAICKLHHRCSRATGCPHSQPHVCEGCSDSRQLCGVCKPIGIETKTGDQYE